MHEEHATTPDQAAGPRPERVTHATARDVRLPGSIGTLCLITLDNELDAPNTLGPIGLAELAGSLDDVAQRASRGELAAVAITGKPSSFAAGADLTQVAGISTREDALTLARLGHDAFARLEDLPVPTFALINAPALGGGFEIALNCDYRAAADNVRILGLPETSLGLVPGWGGSYRAPKLTGIAAAIDVVIRRPAVNRPLTAHEAHELGLIDTLLDSSGFLPAAVEWIAKVVTGEIRPSRREPDSPVEVAVTVQAARQALDATIHRSRPAPYRALDLLVATAAQPRDVAFATEDEALADLMMTNEMRASVYAFSLVRGLRKVAAAPRADARPISRVAIVGAGLMAAQIAVVFAQHLRVPVIMRDLDHERVTAGLQHARAAASRLYRTGRLDGPSAEELVSLITGTTELADLGACDLVVEAVTENLRIKQLVFGELEAVVSPTTILATNTSALSVDAMAAGLAHPERLIGLHFFNPVAAMPLVEVIRGAKSDDEAVTSALAVVAKLRKTAILTIDRPGFVVNRLLVLLLGRVLGAVEAGLDVTEADHALDPLGLPMSPFALLDLVGPAVGLHVLDSLRAELGDRFPAAPGLARLITQGAALVVQAPTGMPVRVDPAIGRFFGVSEAGGRTEGGPRSGPELLDDVLTALAREVGLMLAEGVVSSPSEVDLAMILGAGWGFHLGGITPYLDRSGYSERVLGRRLLPAGLADVPSSRSTK